MNHFNYPLWFMYLTGAIEAGSGIMFRSTLKHHREIYEESWAQLVPVPTLTSVSGY